jgi:hypothetical protein
VVAFAANHHSRASLRHHTAAQLTENIWSITDPDEAGALSGTTRFRTELWSKVLNDQMTDGHLIDGMGFDPNPAADVGAYAGRSDSFRSPHHSHLDILARMGLIGLFPWTCWCWRMNTGCRRPAECGFHSRQRVDIPRRTVVTTVTVSSYFNPQSEGPPVAIPFWALVRIALAAVRERLDHRCAEPTDAVQTRR